MEESKGTDPFLRPKSTPVTPHNPPARWVFCARRSPTMAFDRTDPADLAALKSEVNNDPAGVGYDPTGPTQTILDLLNLAANNPGADTGVPPLTLDELWDIIATENVASGDQFNLSLLYSVGDMERDVSDKRTLISAMDVGIAAKIAALTRALSRAEALFSLLDANGTTEFVTISREDWFAARDS